MVNRELCCTLDPYAYKKEVIEDYAIAAGYSTANDYITYPDGSTHTDTFRTMRVTSFNYTVARNQIVEESIDQVAAASVFGGTYLPQGSFEMFFRGWDMHLSGFLQAALGAQTPASVSANSAHGAGYTYELAQTPATLAVKVVDEQAADTTVGKTMVFRGVGVTSFNISLALNDACKTTCNYIARNIEAFESPYNTNSAITGDQAPFYNATLIWTPSGGSSETMKCKAFSMDIGRTMDQENFFLGSEKLQGLLYNGLTNLGGTLTLSASDWKRVRTTSIGSETDAVLDQGNKEFTGTAASGTVLANAIPSGKLEIVLHTPDGVKEVARITANVAKLTEASADATGRNQFNKTVTWVAQVNATDKFTIDVYNPS